MSGTLIIAVLHEAWTKFGSFPPERQPEIARWVQRRVNEIREGKPVPRTPVPFAPSAEQSWFDREPGEDDQ